MDNRETLSIKQADAIIDTANEIVEKCAADMASASDLFVDKVSQLWEDQNAVTFMTEYKKSFDGFLDELNKNNKAFASNVGGIAAAYIAAGAMTGALSAVAATATAVFDVSKVKTNFAESDEFGFANKDAKGDDVIEAFTELATTLQTAATNAQQRIQDIPAFGNNSVRTNLAASANKIVEILQQHITTTKAKLSEAINTTASAYANVGTNATQAANMSVEAGE